MMMKSVKYLLWLIASISFSPMVLILSLLLRSTYRDCDPLEYIASNYNIKEPLAFVPKPNEALEEYLETYPIEHLMHNWQEDFISPYDEIINQRLTHIALQNLNNAKAVQ